METPTESVHESPLLAELTHCLSVTGSLAARTHVAALAAQQLDEAHDVPEADYLRQVMNECASDADEIALRLEELIEDLRLEASLEGLAEAQREDRSDPG